MIDPFLFLRSGDGFGSQLLVWSTACGGIFWNTYRSYAGRPQYYYLYRMLGVILICLFVFFNKNDRNAYNRERRNVNRK